MNVLSHLLHLHFCELDNWITACLDWLGTVSCVSVGLSLVKHSSITPVLLSVATGSARCVEYLGTAGGLNKSLYKFSRKLLKMFICLLRWASLSKSVGGASSTVQYLIFLPKILTRHVGTHWSRPGHQIASLIYQVSWSNITRYGNGVH